MPSSGNCHAICNIHMYMYSLPADILTEIFLTTAQPQELHYQRLRTVAQVCRKWAHLIKISPTFWRLVDYDAAYTLAAVLARSAGATLDINYTWASKSNRNIDEESTSIHSFFAVVPAEAHRWRYLKMTVAACVGTRPAPCGTPPYSGSGGDLRIIPGWAQDTEISGWRDAAPTLGHSRQIGECSPTFIIWS